MRPLTNLYFLHVVRKPSGPENRLRSTHHPDPDHPKSRASFRVQTRDEEARWDSTGAGAPLLWPGAARGGAAAAPAPAPAPAPARRERVRAAARAGQGPGRARPGGGAGAAARSRRLDAGGAQRRRQRRRLARGRGRAARSTRACSWAGRCAAPRPCARAVPEQARARCARAARVRVPPPPPLTPALASALLNLTRV